MLFLLPYMDKEKTGPAGALAVIDAKNVGMRPVPKNRPGGPMLFWRRLPFVEKPDGAPDEHPHE